MFRPTVFSFMILSLFLLTAGVASASDAVSTSNGLTAAGGPLAVHGFDVVSYFEAGDPQRGLAKFSVNHEGAVYRFASRKHMRQFTRDPQAFVPQFGGFCAYGVSVGKKFDGDPLVYRVVDDKLYFNLNPDIKATWEKDLHENIHKAVSSWPTLRSKAASSL